MTLRLPDLPYAKDALQPYMSAETLEFHHGKHHQTYIDKLNQLVQGTAFENKTAEVIARETQNAPDAKAIFNNAAQTANHTFFWHSLTPKGGGKPLDGPFLKEIVKRFGSFEAFKETFQKVACAQFGSGWTWVVLSSAGDLEVTSTDNAKLPEGKPLLTCDVWEHVLR